MDKRSTLLAASAVLCLSLVTPAVAQDAGAGGPPNILIIWGDDIGQFNVSAYNKGMMGYRTPNIDRHRGRGRALHRLVRPAELHRRARRLHHRPVADPHRPDQGRPARRARGHEDRGPDHRRAPAPARLRHRPVRQEPPRRPRRDAADQQRLRPVLRQPLPPQRRGGAREPRLPGRGELPRLPGEVRPARGDPLVRRARRRPADRGHRPADPRAHADRRRGGHRRRARLHGPGQCRRTSRSSCGGTPPACTSSPT